MEDHIGSKELSRKFDIVLEIEKALDEIDKAFELEDIDEVPELISYIRFLVKDLDLIFSGDYENLRYRDFVIKRK
jgi:CCR4-NOT transcriptional regulation complex NOT5 subunit